MRFGGNDDSVLDRLRWLASTFGPLLGDTLRAGDGIPLKALVARGLSMGDEMHQRNVACTSLLLRALAPALARSTRSSTLLCEVFEFIGDNDQFFLNVAMAMGKAIMDPVGGIDGASIVTAMSRNGTDFGVRLAGTGGRWFTAPVEMPRGLYFPGYSEDDANPDMGDSTIVETVGLGGFAMAASPAVAGFVGAGSASTALGHTRSMYEITAARNPGVDDPRPGLRRRADWNRRAQGGRERARPDHQHRNRPSAAHHRRALPEPNSWPRHHSSFPDSAHGLGAANAAPRLSRPPSSHLPCHRSCMGPTFAGSKMHHDDREMSALGPVTDRPVSIPIPLRQRRSVGCFTYPPTGSVARQVPPTPTASPASRPSVEDLVARLNEHLGVDWSFDVRRHHRNGGGIEVTGS